MQHRQLKIILIWINLTQRNVYFLLLEVEVIRCKIEKKGLSNEIQKD